MTAPGEEAAAADNSGANRWSDADHAEDYLERRESFAFRDLAYDLTLDHLPDTVRRVLDLGTGDGDMLARVLAVNPDATGVGIDFSDTMLDAAGQRLGGDDRVEIRRHDLSRPLPTDLGSFDLVVSAFAIHHLTHDRKRELYGEVFDILEPGGMFANLEHVASPTEALHRRFHETMDILDDDESNKLLDVGTQVDWLRTIGYEDADCHIKWYEVALIAGTKPPH